MTAKQQFIRGLSVVRKKGKTFRVRGIRKFQATYILTSLQGVPHQIRQEGDLVACFLIISQNIPLCLKFFPSIYNTDPFSARFDWTAYYQDALEGPKSRETANTLL